MGAELTAEKRDYIIYFDVLRIISMFAVVMLHTAASNWSTVDVHSFAWKTFNFYDSIVRWGVPVFTMISGAIFLSPERTIKLKTLYSKYIFRIVVAFLAWSLFYAAVYYASTGKIWGAIARVFTGHYHQWFMIMLVGLYIIVPLLRRIVASREATRYFLVVSFVFSFAVPLALLVLSYLDQILNASFSLYEFANGVYSNMHFHLAVGYSFYYVLGFYLHTTEIRPKIEKIVYFCGLAGFALTVFLSQAASSFLGTPTGEFYGNFTCNVLLESVAVFILIKQRIQNRIRGEKLQKIVQAFSKYSFGVYLVHPFFLATLSRLGWKTTSFFPPVSIPVISLAVFALSLCTSALLSRIPILNKYIV